MEKVLDKSQVIWQILTGYETFFGGPKNAQKNKSKDLAGNFCIFADDALYDCWWRGHLR